MTPNYQAFRKDCIDKLEALVGKRYESKSKLEKKLEDLFGCKVKLEASTYCRDDNNKELLEQYKDEIILDWSYVGLIKDKYIYCDIDIYYAKTRANELLITEVNYEFE